MEFAAILTVNGPSLHLQSIDDENRWFEATHIHKLAHGMSKPLRLLITENNAFDLATWSNAMCNIAYIHIRSRIYLHVVLTTQVFTNHCE
jgi:hypothetical protein